MEIGPRGEGRRVDELRCFVMFNVWGVAVAVLQSH
jgi:hypothetical protein